MTKSTFFLSIAISILISAISVSAQDAKVNFGGIQKNELQLKGYVYDLPKFKYPWKMPDAFPEDSLVSIIYTNTINIPTTIFKKGIPGVINKSTWFGIRYEGNFEVANNAFYHFQIKSDDGSKLYIDDQLLIDNDGSHKPRARRDSIYLEKGMHEIKVRYYQGFPHLLCLQLWIAPGSGAPFEFFNSEKVYEAEKAIQLETTVLSDTLLFEYNSYVLTEKAYPSLLSWMQSSIPESFQYLKIVGHTDDKGELEYNQSLSLKRAEAVKAFFVEQGIVTEKIKCIGKGETQPLVPNDKEFNRARNRRVEITIVK